MNEDPEFTYYVSSNELKEERKKATWLGVFYGISLSFGLFLLGQYFI